MQPPTFKTVQFSLPYFWTNSLSATLKLLNTFRAEIRLFFLHFRNGVRLEDFGLWPQMAYCTTSGVYISMQHWWDGNWFGENKVLEKCEPVPYFVLQKSNMNYPETEPKPPWWEATKQPASTAQILPKKNTRVQFLPPKEQTTYLLPRPTS
jgi:hypothetical protein